MKSVEREGLMAKSNSVFVLGWIVSMITMILLCTPVDALLLPAKLSVSLSPSTTACQSFPNLWQQLGQDQEQQIENERGAIGAIPYIIDRLSDRPADRIFDEIADMCIDVFFNKSNNKPMPWKLVQLKYLTTIQAGDLRRRKLSRTDKKRDTQPPQLAMFVARRVIPMESPEAAQASPLILDLDRIVNFDALLENSSATTSLRPTTMDYVRGEIVGFCEISERAYGLGDVPGAALGKKQIPYGQPNPQRPFLTNLSVTREARKSGIGSQLVEACEAAVQNWGGEEVILEVEADNVQAIKFYEKRGYDIVFSDPTGRRFTTDGFLLSKERCVKVCMRKQLNGRKSDTALSPKSALNDVSKFFQAFRESIVW